MASEHEHEVDEQARDAVTQALRLLARPYTDLLALCAKALREPLPERAQWPERALASSVAYWSATFENQYEAYSALAGAYERVRSPEPTAALPIDAHSEAAGPILLEPLVALAPDARLVQPTLVCPGVGAIPQACVLAVPSNGRLAFGLVGLKRPELPALARGRYCGELRLDSGALVARLQVDVVESVVA